MLTIRDLPESTLHANVFLHCPSCDARWSATRGDYFWMHPDEILVCDEDETPYELATERVEIIPV